MSDATTILSRIAAGDAKAADELLPIVYNELRQLASRRLANDPAGQSWQTTELVHEAYLRLVGSDQKWDGNAHFFGAAAEAMRRILVERVRHKKRLKRGGEQNRVMLSEEIAASGPSVEEALLVDDLLDHFAENFPVEAEIVKLRYFAGFSTSEAAKILDIPSTTAHRHWTFAKTWIFRELKKTDE
jgi:RNA polymerase sigma factor (TIGR02999 family)